MKRKILLLATIILSALPIALPAQMTYVPDDNFEQALIDLGLDSGPLNDSIPTKNIDTLTVLDVSQEYISDLTGIGDFKSLTCLYCDSNKLANLDISKNTSLIYLECSYNQLSSLDLSNNTAMIELYCTFNKLTSLYVSKNTALNKLDCFSNQLTGLDITKNTTLTYLDCSFNQLTGLDITKNTALNWLNCYVNKLESLDVSNNHVLNMLYCSINRLTRIDVSNNPVLYDLHCGNNHLTSINVSNNPVLYQLACYKNRLTRIDVSNNPVLYEFFCNDNQLTSLDLSNNPKLFNLLCINNPNLKCIQVADSTWSANNRNWSTDPWAHYSENCNYTGVEDNKYENEAAAISPNPAQDYIELALPPRPPGEGRGEGIRIYNLLGEIVTGLDTPPDPLFLEGGKCRIDVSALPQGTYFLRFGGEIRKFIKY